jgi:hypothetical protein
MRVPHDAFWCQYRDLKELRRGSRPAAAAGGLAGIERVVTWREPAGTPGIMTRRMTWLRRGMSDALKSKLIAVSLPSNFEDYVKEVQQVAWRFEQTSEFKVLPSRQKKCTNAALDSAPVLAQTISSAQSSSIDETGTVDHEGDTTMRMNRLGKGGLRGSKGGKRTQIPSKAAPANRRQRAKWVSKEEREARFQKGLCGRCGASGHFQRGCPYAPPLNPHLSEGSPAARFNATHVVKPELADEWEEVSETSGSEKD